MAIRRLGVPVAPAGVPGAVLGFPGGALGFPIRALGSPNAALGFPPLATGFPDAAMGVPDAALRSANAALGFPGGATGGGRAAVRGIGRVRVGGGAEYGRVVFSGRPGGPMLGVARRVVRLGPGGGVRVTLLGKGAIVPDDFLPGREADLLAWGTAASGLLSDSASTYGIDAATAARFATALTAFKSLYDTVQSHDTRTPAKLTAKKLAKAEFVRVARATIRVVQASPVVTDVQRRQLKITIRSDSHTRQPAPAYAPRLTVTGVDGRTFSLQLGDAMSVNKRGRPQDAATATVMVQVAETPSLTPGDWSLVETTSSMTLQTTLPATTAAGTRVYFSAFWSNRRGETGPMCAPVGSYTQFGGGVQATQRDRRAA